jgi:acyl-CoA thioesterase II
MAYISDHILYAGFLPFDVPLKAIQHFDLASLDHCLWFHLDSLPRDDQAAADWLLYVTEPSKVSQHRVLNTGKLYDRTGRLRLTCLQDGLLRDKRPNSVTRARL